MSAKQETKRRRTRDLTAKQFASALERRGWKPGFWGGYWQHPCGLSMSAWNYQTRRIALAEMIRVGDHYAEHGEMPGRPR